MRFKSFWSNIIGTMTCLAAANLPARTNIQVGFTVNAPVFLRGYSNCYLIGPSWAGPVFVPAYYECGTPYPIAASGYWAPGYWQCINYRHHHCYRRVWTGPQWISGYPSSYQYYQRNHNYYWNQN